MLHPEQPVRLKGNRLQNDLDGAYFPSFRRKGNNHLLENRENPRWPSAMPSARSFSHQFFKSDRLLEIAISETEFHILFKQFGALHATRQDKPNVECVFIGANFRHAGKIAMQN
jgi:hypothetical protein